MIKSSLSLVPLFFFLLLSPFLEPPHGLPGRGDLPPELLEGLGQVPSPGDRRDASRGGGGVRRRRRGGRRRWPLPRRRRARRARRRARRRRARCCPPRSVLHLLHKVLRLPAELGVADARGGQGLRDGGAQGLGGGRGRGGGERERVCVCRRRRFCFFCVVVEDDFGF